jgi:asparagine synthase (glutamine-hydrolysing)
MMQTLNKATGRIFQRSDSPHFMGCWGDALAAPSGLPVGWPDSKPLDQIGIAAAYGFTDLAQADAWVRIDAQGTAGAPRLILGRDALGRVPLYWTQVDGLIWFSSRLQDLLPLKAQTINLPALYGYSCFSYVPSPLTPVEGIFAVPAGTEQVWQTADTPPQSHQRQEWQQSTKTIADEGLAVAELQGLLKAAIDRQISDLSNEPVGLLLSGGLDSAVVAALLVQAGVKVRAYTLDFGDVENPEWGYADRVAQHLHIPLVKVDASPLRVKAALMPTVKALDMPYGDGVTVPLYLLCQAARQDVTVIFNGEGGDQLFAGWTNKPLIAAGLYQGHQPVQDSNSDDFTQQYLRTFHHLWGYEAQIFQPPIGAQVQQLAAADWVQSALDPAFTSSLLQRLRRATLMLKGAQNIHPRATALGWASGLRVRSPFCDPELAAWSFGLADTLTLQASCEKYILKRAVADWLPADIVWREKRGMGVPLTKRCFNDWWSDWGGWLNPDRLRREAIFRPDLAAQIVSGDLGLQGRRMGEALWLLLMWEQWRGQVLGDPPGPPSWDHPFWLPQPIWRYKRYLQRQWQD